MRRKILTGFVLMALTIANSNLLAEGSKQQKDFTVKKTTILNIPRYTSGIIKYKLPKGSYRIEIYSLNKKSNMHLDDCITNADYVYSEWEQNALEPIQIKPMYYKFNVKILDEKYIQGYITTTSRGKLFIKVTKIKNIK